MTTRIVVLMASLLAAGAAGAQSQQAIRDQIFGPTDALKAEADAVHASALAPIAYSEAMELYVEAGDGLQDGKDLERVREQLTEASGLFQRSTEAAKLAQVTFTDALAARADAEKAEAAQYAERDWGKAEEVLHEAAVALEDGNLNKAEKTATDAEELYREVEGLAINNKARAQAAR